MRPFFVYMLTCSDSSYYCGQTDDIESRLQQHYAGEIGYTSTRKPVELVWQGEFESREGAIAFEQQIKGWSRAKKEALIAGDWDQIKQLAKSKTSVPANSQPSVPANSQPSVPANTQPSVPANTQPSVRPEPVEGLAGLRQAQPEREGVCVERGKGLSFEPVVAEDLESLFALRMDVMRESLTRLGLTDLQHSRERYTLQCESGAMQHILCDGERIGFVQLVPAEDHLHLVQLFLRSDIQGGGVGAWVLDWAKSHGQDVTLTTLKQSDANRFYQRHGFVQTGAGEFDNEYRWTATGTAQA